MVNNMRRTGRFRRNKQKKILIIGSLSLLLFLCVGYAAFQTNLSLTARGNIKERNNLYVSSTGSDTKGNGTINKPYATIQKAYNSAWENSTIYVMDNITQTNTVTMDKNKDVILTSYSQTGNTNSIIRSSSLTTHLINVQNGALTLQNITINGNDVPSQDSMINVASEVYMEEGTLITKANNVNDWGGGFSVNGGTLTMNGGTISDCKYTGGAAVFVFGDHQEGDNYEGNKEGTFIMNDGLITNNNSAYTIWSAGKLQFNGGTISNNTSSRFAIINSAGSLNITNTNIINNNTNSTLADGWKAIVKCTNYLQITCNMTMTGGIIANNQIIDGPAISVINNASFTLDGGKIMNNISNGNLYGYGGVYVVNSTYTYKSGIVCGNTPANKYETSTTCPN